MPGPNSGFNPFAFMKRNEAGTSGNNNPNPNTGGTGTGTGANPPLNSAGMPNQPVNKGAGAGTEGGPDLGNSGGDGAGATGNKKPSSPLDSFTDMFTIKNDGSAPPKDPFSEPLFNLDPKKLGEATGKMEFTRGIDPALVQKALQGDAASFLGILNTVSRNAFTAALSTTVGMTERGFGSFKERYDNTLDGRFRDYQVNSMQSTNPALKHPAAAPVIAGIKQMIASQNPNMAPAEVQSQAEAYFLAMGKAMGDLGDGNGTGTGTQGGGTGNKGAAEPDYSMFFQQ